MGEITEGKRAPRVQYILIDYENVQPTPAEWLLMQSENFRVKVFLEPSQTKSEKVMKAVEGGIGANGEIVRVTKSGKNAVDFHIAAYLGKLWNAEPEAFFRVISKDRGYDSLLEHLREKGLSVQRSNRIRKVLTPEERKRFKELRDKATRILKRAAAHPPRTVVKLRNWLRSQLPINEKEAERLSQSLRSLEVFRVNEQDRISFGVETDQVNKD